MGDGFPPGSPKACSGGGHKTDKMSELSFWSAVTGRPPAEFERSQRGQNKKEAAPRQLPL